MGVGMAPHGRVAPSSSVALSIEFDAFSVAVGLAIVAGALSLLAGYLTSLTVALAALAFAGWAARSASSVVPGQRIVSIRGLGISFLVIGIALFLLLPPPWAGGRALVLALSLVPLWAAERPTSRHRPLRPGKGW